MRPAIALTPYVNNIQNISIIYKVALLCICFSFLRDWYNKAPLKYHSWKPYKAMESTQVLYNRYLYIRESSLVELLSIFILLMIDSALLVE